MLTVDYGRLGVRAGDLLLDLGCGFGRHAYEGYRRGARVVALDYSDAELKEVRQVFAAMAEAGEGPADGMTAEVNGDATGLPFPDGTFDRVIASEVLEHIPDDRRAVGELARVLRPGGTLAVTVPAFVPERICWALSDQYHAPAAPGGHVRIYREHGLRARLREAGLKPGAAHHAHALHSPYWWLRCAAGAVGAAGTTEAEHPLVRAYHRFLVWDITERPALTRLLDRALNPLIGKSLVVYARKPAEEPAEEPADARA